MQAERFAQLTRAGKLSRVLRNIDLALKSGLKIKLNSVILKQLNSDEVLDLVDFALSKRLDISFIEEIPLGQITKHRRSEESISSESLRHEITPHYSLTPSSHTTSGPSRYWSTSTHLSLIEFISPHSENLCSSCNRLRLTAEGKVLSCLGNEDSVDIKYILRRYPSDNVRLNQAILDSITKKPERHHFEMDAKPDIVRFMNSTGGSG